MSSVIDHLTPQPGDPDDSTSPGPYSGDTVAEFSPAFAEEVRNLLLDDEPRGLFGAAVEGAAVEGAAVDDIAVEGAAVEGADEASAPVNLFVPTAVPAAETEVVAAAEPEVEVSEDAVDDRGDDDNGPQLFAAPSISVPAAPKESKPAIGLFLPRPEETTERAAPALTGLALPAATAAPAAAPNLFVSSEVAPAEVAFVAAEEVEPNRYRWLVLLLGLLFICVAGWLTWMAQSGETIDAPVTTVATVPTTLSTTEAPAATTASTTASTAASSTEAPSTTAAETTVTTVTAAPPTTVAAPQATARPAPTAAPATAAPTTAAPTTAAPSTAATVPDVTFAPPTWSPNTTAAPAEPPAGPAETAPPATAAPATVAPETAPPALTEAPAEG